MTDWDTALTQQALIENVRNAMAGIDSSKIPDDTIVYNANKVVIPILNEINKDLVDGNSSDQKKFDNAVIAWTAELSFDSWLTFTRLRDREIETFIDPEQYKSQLESRTDLTLNVIGASRPPDVPNVVETAKHPDEWTRADLNRVWEQR